MTLLIPPSHQLEDVHEAAIFVLGNILADDDEQKQNVSLMVGDELLLAFDRFKGNVDFFLKVAPFGWQSRLPLASESVERA